MMRGIIFVLLFLTPLGIQLCSITNNRDYKCRDKKIVSQETSRVPNLESINLINLQKNRREKRHHQESENNQSIFFNTCIVKKTKRWHRIMIMWRLEIIKKLQDYHHLLPNKYSPKSMKIISNVLRFFILKLIKTLIRRSKFLPLKKRSIIKWLRYIRANLLSIRSRNRLAKMSQRVGVLTKKFLENWNPASASANLNISLAVWLKASIPTKILKKPPRL
jgi:hypothetical protein